MVKMVLLANNWFSTRTQVLWNPPLSLSQVAKEKTHNTLIIGHIAQVSLTFMPIWSTNGGSWQRNHKNLRNSLLRWKMAPSRMPVSWIKWKMDVSVVSPSISGTTISISLWQCKISKYNVTIVDVPGYRLYQRDDCRHISARPCCPDCCWWCWWIWS